MMASRTYMASLLIVGLQGGLAAADFVLSGTQHLEVTISHSTGVLYDTSTADVLGGGHVGDAYINDNARLWVRRNPGGESWGRIGAARLYNSGRCIVSGGTVSSLDARDTSVVEISGGSVGSQMGDLRAYHTSIVDISGGGVYRVLGYNTSTVNISGGNVRYLDARDSSRVEIIDGSVGVGGYFAARNASAVDISGGNVSTLWASNTSTVRFHGYDFRTTGGLTLDEDQVVGTGTLTGKWFDGTTWTVDITQNDVTATILAIPEPAPIVMLALAGAGILKKEESVTRLLHL